jgi:hypothetical protein
MWSDFWPRVESVRVKGELQGIKSDLQGVRVELFGREKIPSVPARGHAAAALYLIAQRELAL